MTAKKRPTKAVSDETLNLHKEIASLRSLVIDLSKAVSALSEQVSSKSDRKEVKDIVAGVDRRIAELDIALRRHVADKDSVLEAMVRGATIAVTETGNIKKQIMDVIGERVTENAVQIAIVSAVRTVIAGMPPPLIEGRIYRVIEEEVITAGKRIDKSFRVFLTGVGESVRTIENRVNGDQIHGLPEPIELGEDERTVTAAPPPTPAAPA